MNVDTGEVLPMSTVLEKIKRGETDRRKWRELTPEEHEHLRELTPAERIAWNVRRKLREQRQTARA